jgi:hypothetical protein
VGLVSAWATAAADLQGLAGAGQAWAVAHAEADAGEVLAAHPGAIAILRW